MVGDRGRTLRPVNLSVRVDQELVLDAGVCEELGSLELVVRPPAVMLFRQVLDYLQAKPDPPTATDSTAETEGLAAAGVALRWGSYLAVLADRAKPVWAKAHTPGTSRISNSEMARINIEASAALADWVDIYREDRSRYERLVRRALAYLPLPRMRPRAAGSEFAMLAMPEVADKMIAAVDAARVARVRADAASYPSRVFANSLVNVAWRNGPVENIHAGDVRGYPLDQRRVTTAEERALLACAADRLVTGMEVCRLLALERPPQSWSEQVLPYGLAGARLIAPSGWTLTEATREVRLPRL